MKYFWLILLLPVANVFGQTKSKTENVIIVTFDGFRWQELFTGAEKRLINDKKFVTDRPGLKQQYWAAIPQERRQKLMPFFWGTVAQQGVILGNRKLGNKVNVTNKYHFSYPGYNEIFSGYGDPKVNSNDFPDNPDLTIFDLLNTKPEFKDKMAAFATWDAFPRIINTHRNGVPVFVNFKCDKNGTSCNGVTYSNWQTKAPAGNPWGKTDTMTYHFAKEYIERNHPKVAFIGFDETDDYGHEGKYDAYLNTANMLDRYMQDLWNFIQSDPQYKDKTTLIMTCDHGRGSTTKNRWKHHGRIPSAGQIWIAGIGPDIKALGEVKNHAQYHQKQIAPTLARLLDVDFYKDKKKFEGPIPALDGAQN